MKYEIIKMILEIEGKHPNDPTITTKLNSITEILSKSLDETISCLNELDENSISWISTRFENLSYKFQSKEFIDCIKNLVVKFPNISYLKDDVQDAIDSM